MTLSFSTCKFSTPLLEITFLLTAFSTEDENSLRAKVDEAMTVYDEYVKNNKGGEEAEAGGEESKDEKA